MQRDLAQLAEHEYDIIIVGAGIYGSWAAWDAALRGLSVAVIERDDFGGATSSNSLKIIHGGLRYLQHADLARMRESVRERAILLRVAPHLVHPLACIMPTYGHGLKGREALAIALFMNDVISFDRNLSSDPQKHLPGGRILSRSQARALLPGLEEDGLTGGALWYDCQVYNSERLLLALLRGAEARGARLANYAQVNRLITDEKAVRGVVCTDAETGRQFEVRGRLVLNTAGPWMTELIGNSSVAGDEQKVTLSKAFNLVVKRKLTGDKAVGIPSKVSFSDQDALVKTGSRLLFLTPWRDYTLIGTNHLPYDGRIDDFSVGEDEIQSFLDEYNAAYPAAAISRSDVVHVYAGLLPADANARLNGHVTITKKYRLIDHASIGGRQGLISVLGVKYTTARDVAVKAVDLAVSKLGRKRNPTRTDRQPVQGGDISRYEAFVKEEVTKRPWGLEAEHILHLIRTYGTRYTEVLHHLDENNNWRKRLQLGQRVIAAEIIHAVRNEMSLHLVDVVRRRTELGSAECPESTTLKTCARLMAGELGWSDKKITAEIAAAQAEYPYARP